VMTGAVPNTGWLHECVALDDKGFVKTGPDLSADDLTAFGWPLKRQPYLLEDEPARRVRCRRCPSQKRETCRISRWRGINRGLIYPQGASEILSHDSQN
jgi:hypothetical protein